MVVFLPAERSKTKENKKDCSTGDDKTVYPENLKNPRKRKKKKTKGLTLLYYNARAFSIIPNASTENGPLLFLILK